MYEELYHHGVKGQQWGERNGPPYPLDSKGSSLRKQKKIYKKMNKKLDDLEKTNNKLNKLYDKAAKKTGTPESTVNVYKKYTEKTYNLMKNKIKEAYTLEMKSINDETIKQGEAYINSASFRKIDSKYYKGILYSVSRVPARNEVMNNVYEKYYKE